MNLEISRDRWTTRSGRQWVPVLGEGFRQGFPRSPEDSRPPLLRTHPLRGTEVRSPPVSTPLSLPGGVGWRRRSPSPEGRKCGRTRRRPWCPIGRSESRDLPVEGHGDKDRHGQGFGGSRPQTPSTRVPSPTPEGVEGSKTGWDTGWVKTESVVVDRNPESTRPEGEEDLGVRTVGSGWSDTSSPGCCRLVGLEQTPPSPVVQDPPLTSDDWSMTSVTKSGRTGRGRDSDSSLGRGGSEVGVGREDGVASRGSRTGPRGFDLWGSTDVLPEMGNGVGCPGLGLG